MVVVDLFEREESVFYDHHIVAVVVLVEWADTVVNTVVNTVVVGMIVVNLMEGDSSIRLNRNYP